MATVFRGHNPIDELSPGLKGLLIANGVAYLIKMVFPYEMLKFFALHPIQGGAFSFLPWQLVTYSFLHGGGMHILFNLLILWMFGNHIERMWGTKKFLTYYFTCVVGAAVVHLLTGSTAPTVGASGGIYGLLLAFGFLFPNVIIYVMFIFPMRAIQAVWVFGALALAFSFGQSEGSNIAHFAHLGGMMTGYIYFKFPVWRENFRIAQAEKRFKNPKGKKKKFDFHEYDINQEVDRILEKISAKGLDSLTPEEHETMKKYAKKKN